MPKEQKVLRNLSVENARIGFRNFTGKEGQFNPVGRRNFCVFLDTPTANGLVTDGWNIKWLKPRDPDDQEQAYLQVSVSYDHFPPKIILITENGKTELTEASVNILDWAEIKSVDLIIRPYNWEMSGKKGVKAYIKSMYVTIVEDEFAQKYRNVPDSAVAAIDAVPWEEE